MIYDNSNCPAATVYDMSAHPPTVIANVLDVDTDAATVRRLSDNGMAIDILQFNSIAPGLAYGKIVRFNCYKEKGMKFKGHVMSLKVTDNGKVLVALALPTDPTRGAELSLLVPKDQAAMWLPGTVVTVTIDPDHD